MSISRDERGRGGSLCSVGFSLFSQPVAVDIQKQQVQTAYSHSQPSNGVSSVFSIIYFLILFVSAGQFIYFSCYFCATMSTPTIKKNVQYAQHTKQVPLQKKKEVGGGGGGEWTGQHEFFSFLDPPFRVPNFVVAKNRNATENGISIRPKTLHSHTKNEAKSKSNVLF